MRKDYNLAIEAAKDANAKLYLGPAGLDIYTQASADPACLDRDSRVVYRFIGGKEDWQK
jgi:3-hydroxyisobutyrate dehydrogenase